ncbi:HD1 homeodomain mating-type protein Le.a1-5 [Lentinula edodes]|nr:HD1 homeodomain mating-type protein Le.a1-5 [Lentinula edodes]
MIEPTDDLDNRLLTSLDTFLDGLHLSDLTSSLSNWKHLDNDLVGSHDNGTLNSDTSSLAIGVTECMQLLCDAFLDLQLQAETRAAEFNDELKAAPRESEAPSPTPSRSPSRATRSPSPSSSQLPSGNLPSYIPPSYTWLLSNLHNPYPSTTIRDTIASTTNTPRRLIDAWFVDVRRRIGWTNLIEGRSGLKGGGALTHGKGTPGVRRPHKTLGPPPNPINNLVNGITEVPKYKTRKELVAAATRFFVKPVVDTSDVGMGMGLAFSANANHLSASENQTFTVMADTARMLYRDKLHPTELAVAVTSRVKQWTPGLGEMAKEVREEERRRKRSRGVKREEEEEEEEEYSSDGKKRKRYTSPSDSSTPSSSAPTTPTDATFPSPNTNTNLKRKRAVSFADPASTSSFPTISPSTKRLRSALNSAGVSRSVSDPTPMPLPQQQGQIPPHQQTQPSLQQQTQISKPPPPLTFDGFPVPVLDSWFSAPPSQGFALEQDFGNQWIDPLFFGFPDPVIRSSEQQEQEHGDASNRFAYFSGNANVDVTIPDLHSAFPVFPSSSSSSSSSSLPSTPALSASGSLTEEESEERDSLFGDEEGEGEECAVGVFAGGDGKALTPGDILGGNTNNNNNDTTTTNNNTTTTNNNTTTTNVADTTYPEFSPTNLPLPTLPDLSTLSTLPDLSSLSSFPAFPAFPSTFPNPSSFDTFDFSSFPSLPEFNLDEFPEFLQGSQTQGGLDGDSGFGSNVNVDFGFGSFGGGDGSAGDGDVDVDSFVAMLQSQSQTQTPPQPLPQSQSQIQSQSQTQTQSRGPVLHRRGSGLER